MNIDAVQIPDVIEQMEEWIFERNGCRFISVTNVHVVMEAHHQISFKKVVNSADLVVPDGAPLVWLGRFRGYRLRQRVYGPDLFWTFCRETHEKGYTHFFYGGAPGVAEKLSESLRKVFPSLKVVGTYSPPFRPLLDEEDAQIVKMINQAAPSVLWVGLGCPKQERWMFEHRDRLNVSVMAGIGQAFDICSGRVRQAPGWMRAHGLEWFFRFLQEPRRLWRRYLIYNTQFLCCLFLETLGLRRSD